MPSWRPEALEILDDLFDGVVYVPENRDGTTAYDFYNNAEWEHEALNDATVISAWVPRELETMPAFTTNVEFGYFVKSGKLMYGRPKGAPKTRYLDWLYVKENNRSYATSLRELMITSVAQAYLADHEKVLKGEVA